MPECRVLAVADVLLTPAIVDFQRKVWMPVPTWEIKEECVASLPDGRDVPFSLFSLLGFAADLQSKVWLLIYGALGHDW